MANKNAEIIHRDQIKKLIEICHTDIQHADQVMRLALSLFDQLNPIFELPKMARQWLIYAALLHDVGWVKGRNGHHKTSLEIILSTPILDFQNKDRLIIGSIARYHRKALPNKKHDHYAALEPKEQLWVNKLSLLLRFANALDASHHSIVNELKCNIKKNRVIIQCRVSNKYKAEKLKTVDCLPHLEKILSTRIKLDWIQQE